MRVLLLFTVGFGSACVWGSYFSNRFCWVIVAVMVAAAAIGFRKGKHRKVIHGTAIVCVGCAVGLVLFWRYETFPLKGARQLDGMTTEQTIRISDYSRKAGDGYSVEGTVSSNGRTYDVCLYLNDSQENAALRPGDQLSGTFTFYYTAADDKKMSDYYRGSGIFLLAYQRGDIAYIPAEGGSFRDFPARLRQSIRDLLSSAFPEDTYPFAKALLLGDTSDFSYETDRTMQSSGIRHIVAVSGMHVSIFLLIVYLISGRKRYVAPLLGIPLLFLFALVTGFSPSVIRACIMHGLLLLALLVDREYDAPTALALASLVMFFGNPFVITSVSFQLSVACMAGILLFTGRIYEWILSLKYMRLKKGARLQNKVKNWFAGSVSVTLGAMSLTTPLCALHFGSVSLIGIVTNLLTMQVVGVAFCGVMLVCLAGLVWLPMARGLAWVVSWGIRYVQLVEKLLSEPVWAAIYTNRVTIVTWMCFCYVLTALFLCFKRRKPARYICGIVISLCIALMASWLEPLMYDCVLTVMDIGQGQCILLQSEGKSYLVDCGGSSAEAAADEAAKAILSYGRTKLDGVILTHYDEDHAGGVLPLLSRVDTEAVFLPLGEDDGVEASLASETEAELITVDRTMELTYGEVKITIFPAILEDAGKYSSMCVLFQTEKCAILITGDRDDFGERMLLRQGEIPELDVLIVGHHGSKYSTCEEFLAATSPEIAIISAGENNRYGHPTQEVLDRLEQFGCRIYRTDLNGTVVIRR